MKRMLNRFRRSLPARLLLVFVLVCLCVIALIVATLARGFGAQWDDGIKPHLNQYLSYVNADIGDPPDIRRAEELTKNLPINIYIDGPDQSYSSTGLAHELKYLSFDNKPKHRRQHPSDLKNQSLSFGELDERTILRNQIGNYTVYFELLHGGREARRSGTVIRALLWLSAILIASYLFLRHMLKPVQDIRRGVRRMGQGELDYRVPVRAENDLGELADSINHMAEDIEGMLDAKRQLLLAVSHELRSPLTRAKVAVQMLEPSNTQRSIAEDLTEMQSLISEILEAERMNGRHAALNRSVLSLDKLIQSVVDEFTQAEIHVDLQPELPSLSLDETRMHLLLRNLISNALTHSQDTAKAPIISARVLAQTLLITVRDFGAGIEAEHIPHLSEPFYRADSSRTRATGGFGLGLHLCKLIAEAHGGQLQIRSKLGEGSSMSVELPLRGDNAGS